MQTTNQCWYKIVETSKYRTYSDLNIAWRAASCLRGMNLGRSGGARKMFATSRRSGSPVWMRVNVCQWVASRRERRPRNRSWIPASSQTSRGPKGSYNTRRLNSVVKCVTKNSKRRGGHSQDSVEMEEECRYVSILLWCAGYYKGEGLYNIVLDLTT